MPTKHLLLALFVVLIAPLQLPADEAISLRDNARSMLALRSAAGYVLDEMARRSSTQGWDTVALTDYLAAQMLEHAREHRRPGQDSRPRCLALATNFQRAALDVVLSNAVTEARARSPIPVSADDVLALAGPGWREQSAAALAWFTSNQFETVFQEARLRAVARQRKTGLDGVRYPEAGALDERLTGISKQQDPPGVRLDAKAFNALDGWLKSLDGGNRMPLFEEVQKQFDDAMASRRDEIRRQYEEQIAAIERQSRELAGSMIVYPAITNELARALDAFIRQRREQAADAGSAVPVYPAFSIVNAFMHEQAGRLEARRMEEHLASGAAPVIAEKQLKDAITGDLPAHVARARSEEILFAMLAPEKGRESAMTLAKRAGAPDDDGRALAARLAGNDPVAVIFATWLRADLTNKLDHVREEIADEQIEQHFAFLPGTRPLPDAMIADVIKREGQPFGDLADAVDWVRGEAAAPFDASNLLEETTAKAIASVNESVRLAHETVQAQMRIVRNLEETRRELLVSDVASGRSVDDILKEWIAAFEREWKQADAALRAIYPEMLASTRDELNKTVRQLYDALKQQQAGTPAPASAAVSPSEQQRDEPDEQDKDSAEVEEHTLEEALLLSCDASLIIYDAAPDRCEAVLWLGPEAPVMKIQFPPDDPEKAAGLLFEQLKPVLADLMASKDETWAQPDRVFLVFRRKSELVFRFYMIINSREIRHQTSLSLRAKIGELLEEWSASHRGGQVIKLDWTVGLGAKSGRE